MAEPTNTPVPTPRSASPALPLSAVYSPAVATGPIPQRPAPAHAAAAWSSSSSSSSPPAAAAATAAAAAKGRPVVLHLGDPVRYNPATYEAFSAAFDVVRPAAAERRRPEFARALRGRRWGDFAAVFRPSWGAGGEMGRWDEELVALLPASVRVFAAAGAGFDWVDTEALGRRGITYCNSGLAAAESVADFAVAMVISTFRHLPWCMAAAALPYLPGLAPADQAGGLFAACHALATAQARNPRGHALGIVGLGNVGQHLAAKLGSPAFGMRVHYTDLARKPAGLERRLVAAGEGGGATFHPTLESLLAASDCVVLCAPAAPGGAPLLTRAALAHLRPGARVVNVARGSLVDEEALADALEDGRVAAAALDVHAAEPRVNPRLARMAGPDVLSPAPPGGEHAAGPGRHPGRVMLTCHNAGGTVDAHAGFEELSMRNIMAVLGGGEALTPVNLRYLKREGPADASL